MKKTIFTSALLLLAAIASAQSSCLDSVIIEKYYISDVNDTSVNSIGGPLPIGSTTYRIYVDMKPGCKFEAAYGVDTQPIGTVNSGDHELRISTTTLFFNNNDRGATTPTYTKNNAKGNTVMLDSWLSVGAGCAANFGVLKSDDNGVGTVVNNDGVLQNNDPNAGIPLTVQDGLLAGTPEQVTTVGITSEIAVFDNVNAGPLFSTYNGSWASLNGSVGPTADNKILIAQITTDGQLCFQLNLQLGTPTVGVTESWVATNPVSGEATHPTLSYCSTPVSVSEIANRAISFGAYPNPAGADFNLYINETGQDCSYSIFSLDGKIIWSRKIGRITGSYEEKIDLSTVAPGMYFIEVTSGHARSVRKLVKN